MTREKKEESEPDKPDAPAEFEIIRRYFSRPDAQADTAIPLGAGDDCALLAPAPGKSLAVTTDALVAGVHFFPDAQACALGWKTLAVSLSDLAAMGARPRWALLSLTLPEVNDDWLAAFSEGFYACADAYSVKLVGGDTTCGPLALSVTALGEIAAERALCRHTAKAGDDVYISGYPGLASLALREIKGEITLPESIRESCHERLRAPKPRVELGLQLAGIAHAAIDVSDGLMNDLGHIACRSGLDARVFRQALPPLSGTISEDVAEDIFLSAILAGGDDYELAFTAAPECRAALAALAGRLALPLWRIGEMAIPLPGNRPASRLIAPDGAEIPRRWAGYEHFTPSGNLDLPGGEMCYHPAQFKSSIQEQGI